MRLARTTRKIRETRETSAAGGLAPEDRLLVTLARRRLDPDHQDAAGQLLAHPLSWPALLGRARTHGLVPLVYRNLADLGFAGVPPEVQGRLRQEFHANALRNDLLAAELADLLVALGGAGIPVIAWKGVPLAERLFGDRALRVCADIDLVVPPPLARRACELLRDRGYGRVATEGGRSPRMLDRLQEWTLVRPVGGGGGQVAVDLHWAMAAQRSGARASDELWADARPAVVLGAPAFDLSPEWELLAVAVHAASHGWRALKWLVDVHEACALDGLDWAALAAKARWLGWDAALSLSLGASRQVLGTRLPAPAAGLAREPTRGVPVFPASSLASVWHGQRVCLLLERGVGDRLRFLGHNAFTPGANDRASIPLPDRLGFLYYAVRPIRLTARYGPWAVASASRAVRRRTGRRATGS